MVELVYVHDFEIMSGFTLLACLAILNGKFWAAVYILQTHGWGLWVLTHCDRVAHICVRKLTIIGLDNGLSPGLRQAIIWTNFGMEYR